MENMIRYLYEYRDGRRVRNVGFVKAEQDDQMGTLQIHGRATFLRQADIRVYVFFTEKDNCYGIPMGELHGVQSIVSARLSYDREEIEKYTDYDAVRGVILDAGEQGSFAAVWDESVVPVERMRLARERTKTPFREGADQMAEPERDETSRPELTDPSEPEQRTETEERKSPETAAEEERGKEEMKEDETVKDETAEDETVEDDTAEDETTVPEAVDVLRAAADETTGNEGYPEENTIEKQAEPESAEAAVLEVQSEEPESAGTASTEEQPEEPESAGAVSAKEQLEEPESAEAAVLEVQSEEPESAGTAFTEEQPEEPESAGAVSAKEQPEVTECAEGASEEGQSRKQENGDVEAASQEERPAGPRYRKVSRESITELPRNEWYLANNSFLMHGCRNYRHLLFIEDGDEFYIGVPGIYHPREAMAARSFGFPEFRKITPEDRRSIGLAAQEMNTREIFGYWCRRINRQQRP